MKIIVGVLQILLEKLVLMDFHLRFKEGDLVVLENKDLCEVVRTDAHFMEVVVDSFAFATTIIFCVH